MRSRTVQETFTFDTWLKALEKATRGHELVRALDVAAQLAGEAFGARLWFVQILGRRWSYVAGCRSQAPAESPIGRLPLANNIGLVCEGWGRLPRKDRARLIAFLSRLISVGQQP